MKKTQAYHPFKDYVQYEWRKDQDFSPFVVECEIRYREVKH